MPARFHLRATSLLLAELCACAEATFEVDDMDVVSEATRVITWKHSTSKVDVLLVVDDSAAMALAQEQLARGFGRFVDILELADVRADYRIAVIDAAIDNPACPAAADAGAMRLSSCLARPDDFVVAASGDDRHAEARTDACSFDAITTLPTTTEHDAVPRPRPWIERVEGRYNLARSGDRTPTAREALQCVGPQGVAGCEFQAPLEAMYQALLRMNDADDPQYGFLRSDASLVIVLVTNGTDCSVDPERTSIFLPAAQGGDPAAFWSDPDAAAPTRAVCWNAGVECSGGPGVYDECHAGNHDIAGAAGADDDEAVLYPLSRYLELLEQLERSKQAIFPERHVFVELIGGVPPGFRVGQASVPYADAHDPAEQREYGIGAGCVYNTTDPPLMARPPVRELEVAEATRIDYEHAAISMCGEAYEEVLYPISPFVDDVLHFACMPVCVADADPTTHELEPTCHVDRATPGPGGRIDREVIQRCNADGTLPAGESACVELLVDEQLSQYCRDEGWNLEFRMRSSDPLTTPIGTTITATCLLSQQPRIDCPDLP